MRFNVGFILLCVRFDIYFHTYHFESHTFIPFSYESDLNRLFEECTLRVGGDRRGAKQTDLNRSPDDRRGAKRPGGSKGREV